MKKIKDLLGNQREYIKDYKLTFSLLIGLTLLMVLIGFDSLEVIKFYVGIIFINILTFAIESFTKKKSNIIVLEVLSILISILSTTQIFEGPPQRILLLIFGFYTIVGFMTIYKISKKYSLKEYLISVFENNMLLSIASFIVQIGLLFIVSIIQLLILNSFNFELYIKVEVLFLGCFLTPGIILSLLNVRNESNKLTKKLITIIILPLVLLSEIIIYLYLTKIILIWDLPSNEIYRIIAFLFVAAYPTWIMLENFVEENKTINNIRKYIPYTFIPLIMLQTFALGIRIINNGFTISRSIGLYFIIFEIAAIIYSLIRNKKEHNQIFIIICILIGLVSIIPKINIIDISLNSQLKRLEKIYSKDIYFESLNNDDKQKIKSSYDYIVYSLDQKDKIPSYIDAKKINDYYYYSDPYTDTKNINYSGKKQDEINIKNYSKMKPISYYGYYYSREKPINEVAGEIAKELEEDNIESDIELFIKNTMNKGKITNNVIKLNNNTDLYITDFSMNYNETDKKLESLDIVGYLLKK